MSQIRQPAVAGAFYLGQRQTLSRDLRAMLDAVPPGLASALPVPKAIIVPHAGYAYSGAVAAAAYRTLDNEAAASIRHVVLLGPSHRVKMRGLALPSYDHFSTPFGQVRVNYQGRRRLRELGLAGIADALISHP